MNVQLFHSRTGKGILLGLIASCLLCSANASAQSYVGGSFSVKGNSARTSARTMAVTTNTSSLNLAPDLGWFLGERLAVGVRPWIGFDSASQDGIDTKTFSFGLNPYARYLVLDHGGFGLWAEADPVLGFSNSRNETREHVWVSTTRTTTYGLEIMPVLTYRLNRHISLESRLNLLSLSLLGNHIVSSDGVEQNISSGGLAVTSEDIAGALGDITIGFVYNF